MSENPLLDLKTRHRPLPFDQVRPGHILPALTTALDDARQRIASIVDNPESPTFDNTILPLESCDEWADRVTAVYSHLLNVDGKPELQDLNDKIPPMIAGFRSDVNLNQPLFQRVKTVYLQRHRESLSPEQLTALENHYLAFIRNGANLSPVDQNTLRDLDHRLSVCSPNFAQNVLKATRQYALWVADPQLVDPLPHAARDNARAAAAADHRPDAWKFTLDMPSFVAFMTYAPDENLRREMYLAYARRCTNGEFSNLRLIREILKLREQRARLLGYAHHADYVLERRMVRDLPSLLAFYDNMIPVVLPAAQRDLEHVRDLKESETGDPHLHPWDYPYYAERLKKQTFQLDQEALRPWFEYRHTLHAIFQLCERLFHLRFLPTNDLPLYADNVDVFRVEHAHSGRFIGHLYLDPFPRDTKRPGAWMNGMLGQGTWNGQLQRPDVAIVANFTPPSDDGIALLTFNEASTLFHEFGHALHELLSECHLRSLAGTRVFWDFVELPSQLMENWLTSPEFLRQYARHHKTNEPLPEHFIQRIRKSLTFQKGYQAARQLSFGLLDLAWHTTPANQLGDDLLAFEHRAMDPLRLFPPQSGTAMSPSFQHLFSGGYAAGYYSYKWAEVLEADVFEAFQEEGLFNPNTAKRLHDSILSQGGSRPPMDLFTDFRGRQPDPHALLRRDGLLP